MVRGTIVRLERTRRTGGDDTADVALQLAFHAAGERVPLLAHEYARSVPLAADDMSVCVAALGKAVEDIFAEWMADLGAAWQP